jgi:hypothetical protein
VTIPFWAWQKLQRKPGNTQAYTAELVPDNENILREQVRTGLGELHMGPALMPPQPLRIHLKIIGIARARVVAVFQLLLECRDIGGNI